MHYALLLNLGFREVLSDIPLNAGTIVVLVVFGIIGAFIWYGSRSGPVESTTTSASAPPDRGDDAGPDRDRIR